MKSAQELFDQTRRQARESFEKDGHHMPMFVIDSPVGVNIVGATFSTEREKEAAVLAIRDICRGFEATRVAYVLEGWMTTYDENADVSKAPRPSVDPRRVEVLFVTVQTVVRGESEASGYYIVSRTSEGKASLSEFKSLSTIGFGLFDNLLAAPVVQ